ncbi:MAG: RHS repeat-associated core domain-containing protein, partial [Thermoanaerobaculia bacterium]|nr:RHS repeat-associated core domain-containing protein [Thermoanaerobaculia bacterium]
GLRTLRYPSGGEARYELDPLGRPRSIVHSASDEPIASFEYLGDDRLLRAIYGNGAQLGYAGPTGRLEGLDVLGRVTRQRWSVRSGTDPPVDVTYRRDRLDRVTSISAADGAVEAGYDSANRTVAFGDTTWGLDGSGNWRRVERAGATLEPDVGRGNRYADLAGRPQSHDPAGSVTDDGRLTYSWDAFGRLREVRDSSTGRPVASYAYDPLGRRVAKTLASGEQTGYLYSGWHEVEEHRGGGVQQYVQGAGIDNVQARVTPARDGSAGRIAWAHYDRHPHNVAALSDERGDVLGRFSYDPFGADAGAEGDVATAAAATDWPFYYQGRRRDPETGLYYFRARYYDPERGRFLSPDPEQPFSTATLGNAYAFGPGGALNGGDPFGLYWQAQKSGGVRWMGKPGEEDYGFTTVYGHEDSWFDSWPDYVFEPSRPPPRPEPDPEPDPEPEPEAPPPEGFGTQLGLAEEGLWHINAKKLDSKANFQLMQFVYVEAFAALGMTRIGGLFDDMPLPRGRQPDGDDLNITFFHRNTLHDDAQRAISDARIMRNSKKIKQFGDFTDIVGHGNRRGQISIPGYGRANAATLARFLRMSPKYKGGPIRLVVCHGGRRGGLAAELSKILRVPVLAASKRVRLHGSGRLSVEGSGGWYMHMPAGGRMRFAN